MILVVGATGRLGGDITRRFHALGYPVRALVRPTSDPAKVSALQALGTFRSLTDAQMQETRRRAEKAIEGKGPCWWNPPAG